MNTKRNLSMIDYFNMRAPYWVFIQAYEQSGGGGQRLPSESDGRMQTYVSLAYGFMGISYFLFDAEFDRGLLEKDFKPNRLYYDIIPLNKEVTNIGKSLRFLKSTDVRYISGKHYEKDFKMVVNNQLPDGIALYNSNSRVAEKITDIAIGSDGYDKDGLIGYFTDDAGGYYFMIVNLYHGKGESAERKKLAFTLKFAPSVMMLSCLSRTTGQPEKVDIQNGSLKIELPGGTGELFKIGDANFPGL